MTTPRRDEIKVRRTVVGMLLIFVFAALSPPARAQDVGKTPNTVAKRWFEDAGLGMFIHWGVYSLLGKGEWVMNNDKIPIAEYQKLPPTFNPTKFDAEAWVKLAKSAGARYITVTTKHHDGFCMFDSKLTDYDIVDATPYGKDPIKDLADACRKHGVKLFFYYSILDWHHPDYFPLGRTGHHTGREAKGDWKKYVEYHQGQVRELCTNYGEIGGIWFDGWWDHYDKVDWNLEGTYKLIHELQPGALVGNNHHAAPFPGEDFQIFEQDLPGKNTAGFNKAEATTELPLETCLTMNKSWGYNAGDHNYKSVEDIVHALAGAAGRGANLLLNVGPKPDGTIPEEAVERLEALGQWLGKYGESIYGTRRGPIPPADWGVTTAREGRGGKAPTVYLHVLAPKVRALELPKEFLPSLVSPFGTMTPLKWTKEDDKARLAIPDEARTPMDTILVVSPPAPSGKPIADPLK